MQNYLKTRDDHSTHSRSMNNSKAVTATSMKKAQLNLLLNGPYIFVKQILKASFSLGLCNGIF